LIRFVLKRAQIEEGLVKPAVNSKIRAVILAVIVAAFIFWWYMTPFFFLGPLMGGLGGLFTYFVLTTRKMERLRVVFFLVIAGFVIVTLTANILYIGYHSFREFVRLWDTSYFNPNAEGIGTSTFPLPELIPTILLGRASFSIVGTVWQAEAPSSLDLFLLFMVPYAITFIVFERAFCGWMCPMGGLPEATSSIKRKRVWYLKFLEKKPSEPGGFSLTGLSGLKGWVEWLRYAILAFIIILSLLVPFSIVNIISPALWVKSIPVFWVVAGLLVVFAVVLPFMTKRRWWCFILCPVGATLALFHKISFFRIKIDKTKCNECMDCVQECRMFAMTPQGVQKGEPNSGNCIRCGRCIEACPEEAIDIAWLGKYRNVRAAFLTMIITAVFAWYLWFVVLLTAFAQHLNNFAIN
jgi:ferredoxin-type protein NapH